jgi:hypothetical protein
MRFLELSVGTESVFVLLIAILVAVMTIALRRRQRTKATDLAGAPDLIVTLQYSKPRSPLQRIKFEEARDVVSFSQAISDYTRENLLFSVGADPASALIQMLAIRESERGVTLICEMTAKGRHLFEKGQAVFTLHRNSGSVLPVLRDSESQKFVEVLPGKPARWTQLANLSSLVVSAAHVISAMDIAKRLGNIEKKLERLEAYRKIDQYSTLERIYIKSAGAIDAGDRESLLRYRDELLELRIQWRRELENVIGSAPELQWRWAADWAKPSRWGPQARRDKQLTNHILPELFRLPSIRMAYFIDLCLAEATETLPEMLGNVLPHEIRMLEQVFAGLQELESKVASCRHRDDLHAALEVFRGLLDPQRCLVATAISERN